MTGLPKLSRALRAKTDLEIRRNLKNSNKENNQKLARNGRVKRQVTWNEFKTFISKESDQATASKVSSHLQTLWNLTKDLIGTEENATLVDNATINILRMFLDVRIATVKHQSKLKKMFGTVPPQVVNKMCSEVIEISPLLNDECRRFLDTILCESEEKKHLWGSHITCKLPDYDQPSYKLLQDLSPNLIGQSKTALTFSMKYNKKEPSTSRDQQINNEGLYTRSWLSKYVNAALVDNLIDLLKSKESNDELQNDLFELLGFDKFEIIQEIFQHRKEIIEKFKFSEMKKVLTDKILAKQDRSKPQMQVPSLASGVVVQSEQEKQLIKQARKDEKKLNRLMNTVAKDLNKENIDTINPLKLRYEQQQKLLETVSCQPSLKDTPKKVATVHQPRYRFLFDSQNEAK